MPYITSYSSRCRGISVKYWLAQHFVGLRYLLIFIFLLLFFRMPDYIREILENEGFISGNG